MKNWIIYVVRYLFIRVLPALYGIYEVIILHDLLIAVVY